MWTSKTFRKQEFIPLLQFLVKMYRPDTYVEIGIQNGYTFQQIAPLVTKAIGVDIKIPLEVRISCDFSSMTLYESDSLSVAKSWKDCPIDLLFIDGDHKCDAVLADVDAFLPYVREGTGLILLHDTYPSSEYLLADGYCSDAWKAAREIHNNLKYKDVEIVTLPGPYAGLSILRKCKQHLHWKTR